VELEICWSGESNDEPLMFDARASILQVVSGGDAQREEGEHDLRACGVEWVGVKGILVFVAVEI